MLTQDQRIRSEQFRTRISRSDGVETGSSGLPQSTGAKIVAGLRRPSQLIQAHFDQKRQHKIPSEIIMLFKAIPFQTIC